MKRERDAAMDAAVDMERQLFELRKRADRAVQALERAKFVLEATEHEAYCMAWSEDEASCDCAVPGALRVIKRALK